MISLVIGTNTCFEELIKDAPYVCTILHYDWRWESWGGNHIKEESRSWSRQVLTSWVCQRQFGWDTWSKSLTAFEERITHGMGPCDGHFGAGLTNSVPLCPSSQLLSRDSDVHLVENRCIIVMKNLSFFLKALASIVNAACWQRGKKLLLVLSKRLWLWEENVFSKGFCIFSISGKSDRCSFKCETWQQGFNEGSSPSPNPDSQDENTFLHL